MFWYVIAGTVVAATVLSTLLLGAARRRYAAVLAAVELCQRQLTELRTALDEQRAAASEVRDLVAETVAPGIARLERARCLAQAARELERALEQGSVEAGAAAAVIEQLERLEAEVLAGERGY
jgi:hypothetical protein